MPIPQEEARRRPAAVRDGVDPGPDRGERDRSTRSASASALWRRGGWPGVTPTTRRLLEYWTDPSASGKLFFCQIEALETAIYIDRGARQAVRRRLDRERPRARRRTTPTRACTGSPQDGDRHRQDRRHGDADRLADAEQAGEPAGRALLRRVPDRHARHHDPRPAARAAARATRTTTTASATSSRRRPRTARPGADRDHELPRASCCARRRRVEADQGDPRRRRRHEPVHRDAGPDGAPRLPRARHEERRSSSSTTRPTTATAQRVGGRGRERFPSDGRGASRRPSERDEEARVWITGLEAVNAKIGVKVVYDLSATPFFLRGSGYPEGHAVPLGRVRLLADRRHRGGHREGPARPVADDAMRRRPADLPQPLAAHPRGPAEEGRAASRTSATSAELPAELEARCTASTATTRSRSTQWRERRRPSTGRHDAAGLHRRLQQHERLEAGLRLRSPAGRSRVGDDGTTVPVQGELPLFSQRRRDGGWLARPNTILVDSEQLESGEAMSADFKKARRRRDRASSRPSTAQRFPGRDADELTDEDLLREVMNTVGKPGRLGEHIRCVVSVSMLTEGWDANTVTHILGVRAFGTQLLCEQVVGPRAAPRSYVRQRRRAVRARVRRGLRRAVQLHPDRGQRRTRKPPPKACTACARLTERAACEITLPARRRLPLRARRRATRARVHRRASRLTLSTKDVPTETDVRPIVGEQDMHTLDDLKRRATQEVAFALAKRVLERYYPRPALALPAAAARSHATGCAPCVTLKDNTFLSNAPARPSMPSARCEQHPPRDRRADEAQRTPHSRCSRPYDPSRLDARTSTSTRPSRSCRPIPSKCHVSDVVADSGLGAEDGRSGSRRWTRSRAT